MHQNLNETKVIVNLNVEMKSFEQGSVSSIYIFGASLDIWIRNGRQFSTIAYI